MKNQNAGFSVIELVVTLALVGILATIAATSMTGLEKKTTRTGSTFELRTALIYARQQAAHLSQNVALVANDNDGDWAQGWVVMTVQDNRVLRTFPPLGGSTTLLSRDNNTTYMFDSAGVLPGSDIIYVCDSRTRDEIGRQLTISPVGRVQSDSNYQCD